MKFVYQYRTKDNVAHKGVVDAPTRDEAYSLLKAKGIKPGRMEEAPGFFNKLFGKGKRWIAIVTLSVIVGTLAYMLFSRPTVEGDPYSINGLAKEIARRQIWGDDVIVDSATRTNWRDVFNNSAECILAMFAQPGKQVKIPAPPADLEASFNESLKKPISILDDDLDEYKQVKCIVSGMKQELREYLKDGGTLQQYLGRLVERQNAEISLLSQESKKLEQASYIKGADVSRIWRETNARLRGMGLPALPRPELKR